MTVVQQAARNLKQLTSSWFGSPTLPNVVLGMLLATAFPSTEGKVAAFVVATGIYLVGDRVDKRLDAVIDDASDELQDAAGGESDGR